VSLLKTRFGRIDGAGLLYSLGMFSSTFSSRDAGLKPKNCSFVVNSVSPWGVRRLVFGCACHQSSAGARQRSADSLGVSESSSGEEQIDLENQKLMNVRRASMTSARVTSPAEMALGPKLRVPPPRSSDANSLCGHGLACRTGICPTFQRDNFPRRF
jgi:hypothetical protein